MNFAEIIRFGMKLFSKRNRLFLSSTHMRLMFLSVAIQDLHDGVRKAKVADYPRLCARILSRIICHIEAYDGIPFLDIACRKYPLTECVYCRRMPCGKECLSPARPKAKLRDFADPGQLTWCVNTWAAKAREVYGPANEIHGIHFLIGRLSKECMELFQADPLITHYHSMQAAEEALSEELADVFLWLIAVSNALEVDLEDAYLKKYGRGCTKCKGATLCTCTYFDQKQAYANSTIRR